MKFLNKTPFWVTAFVCPMLMLAGIYNLGYLVGYLSYLDSHHLTSEQVIRLLSVVVALVAAVIFFLRFGDIKQRLFSGS